jgi:hypothetical protein
VRRSVQIPRPSPPWRIQTEVLGVLGYTQAWGIHGTSLPPLLWNGAADSLRSIVATFTQRLFAGPKDSGLELGHVAVDSGFDFSAAIKEACRLEHLYDDDLFTPTPVSTPDLTSNSTPTSSPRVLPVDFPTEPGDNDATMRLGGTYLPAQPGEVEPLGLNGPRKKRKLACSHDEGAGPLRSVHVGSPPNSLSPTTPQLNSKDRQRKKRRSNRREKREHQREEFGGAVPRIQFHHSRQSPFFDESRVTHFCI